MLTCSSVAKQHDLVLLYLIKVRNNYIASNQACKTKLASWPWHCSLMYGYLIQYFFCFNLKRCQLKCSESNFEVTFHCGCADIVLRMVSL